MIIPPSASPVWVKSELSKKQDKLTQGGGISISNNVVSVDLAEATQTSSGLMSADDKKNLEALKAGTITEYVKGVTLDNYALKLTRSDGTVVQPTLTAVEVNPSTDNASYPVMLGTSTSKGYQSAKVVAGVTVNPSAKAITASKFYGALEGTASKAVADADGNTISSTYAKTTALSGYLPLAGGALTGNLSIGGTTSFGGNVTMDGSGTPLIIGSNGKIGLRAKGAGLANAGQINISDSWYGAGNNRWGAQMSAYDSVGNRYNQFRVSHDGLQYLIYDNATGVETAQQVALIDDIPDVSGFATKDEIGLLPTLDIKVVSALPASGISSKVMYLVPSANGTNDQYDQYIYVNGQWERIGSGMIAVDSALSSTSSNPVQNKVIFTALSGKLDSTGTAAKATADGSGNNIASTYAKKADIPTAGSNILISGGVISATDQKVGQASAGGFDNDFPILLKTSPNTNTETGSVGFAPGVSINPKTGHIKATAFDGTASKATADASGNVITDTYMTLGTAQTVTGAKAFTGQVGNTQSTPGVYLGLDTNASAPNANIAIVSANSAAYIDMGKPNEDYGFRIIKWDAGSGDIAQLCYSNATLTVPRANGTLALVEQIPDVSGFATKSELTGYLPLTGGTVSGLTKIRATESGGQDSVLKVLSTEAGGWAGQWRGRLLVGAENRTFLMGVYNDICGIGAHSWSSANDGTGAAWDDVYINPDGDKTVYIGGHTWAHDTGILAIRNADDKVLYNGKEIATKEDVATGGGSYLPLTGGTLTGGLTISYESLGQKMGSIALGDTSYIMTLGDGMMLGASSSTTSTGQAVTLDPTSGLIPVIYSDGSSNPSLGSSGAQWKEIHGKAIYQDGKQVATLEDLAGVSGGGSGDYLPLTGGTLSGNLEWSNSSTWCIPYLLAFKNAAGNSVTYPYTGFYQWGPEWQVNARDASNTYVHNLLSINNETRVATFGARPTVNGAGLAMQSEVPRITISPDEPSGGQDGDIWLQYEE